MLYQYPFCYRNDYFLVGGKKVAHRYLIDTFTVEIPELTDEEAPIAARWESFADFERGTLHVRHSDGLFLRPLVYNSAHDDVGFDASDLPVRGRSTQQTANNLLSTLSAHWDVGRYHSPTKEWLINGKEQQAPKPSDVASYLGSTHGEMETLARRLADRLRIVDGKVYTATNEPVFHVSPELHNEVHILFISGIPSRLGAGYGQPASNFEQRLYNLTDLAEMRERAERREGGTTRYRYGNLAVFLPDVFGFDVHEHSAGMALARVIHEYSRVPLIDWDRGALTDFHKLHEDFVAYAEGSRQFDVLDLMSRVKEIIGSQGGMIHDGYVAFLRACEIADSAPMRIDAQALIGRTPNFR